MANIQVRSAGIRHRAFAEMAEVVAAVQQRAFERFLARGGEAGQELDDWLAAEREVIGWPVAELVEGTAAFEIELALGGFAARDIAVVAGRDRIVIRADTQRRPRGRAQQVLWSEFGRRAFARQVMVPSTIVPAQVRAHLTNGLLRVVAPKARVLPGAPCGPDVGHVA
ncbi:MAG: Hsp20 family protein [Gemmatimonadetes bacterium]|nr:Hsp20 family protein [Gemmatimonadota bacterium]